MTEATRTFLPDRASDGEIREALAGRVRLKVTEQRRWFFRTAFIVTGPASVIEAAARDIDALEQDAWGSEQW